MDGREIEIERERVTNSLLAIRSMCTNSYWRIDREGEEKLT
jgi:hypothetical protein